MPNAVTRRSFFLIAGALPILVATKSTAMFALMTDEDLVQRSDLIVTATLTDISEPTDTALRRVGTLSIQTVLKGPEDLGSAQIALPRGNGPVSSSDIDYPLNSSGLWFLRAIADQTPVSYAADTPQRFVAQDEAAKVIKAITPYLVD